MSDTLKMIPASQSAENLREMHEGVKDMTLEERRTYMARFAGFLSNYIPREVWSECVKLANEAAAQDRPRGLDDEVGYGLPKGKEK